MLKIEGLVAGYAGTAVLHGIDLALAQDEIATLIGSNGAGKSTLVQCISGLRTPMAGRILLDGQPIGALRPADRLRLGIAHVPEGRQVFGAMTVAENLALGGRIARPGATRAQRLDQVCTDFPILRDRMHDPAGNLSGGQQQMLAIARGLMSGPRLLLLDEPSLGLSPLLVADVFRLIQRLRGQGLTILLAEQNARSALSIADRGHVVENGRIRLEGPAAALLASPEIDQRYLGGSSGAPRPSGAADSLARRLQDCIGTPA